MYIITHRNVFFVITGALVLASAAALFVYGLKFGTDFTGGALVEVRYVIERPDAVALHAALTEAGINSVSLRNAGETDVIMRSESLNDAQRASLTQLFSMNGTAPVTISQLTEVGPTIGNELRTKSVWAIILVLLAILLFIAFAFRKVSKPISSWVYGFIALITLLHDVIVPAGFFALLGHFEGAQVDALFVTAILTVLGFSIHDTIVVFDRVRENLRKNADRGRKEDFAITAGNSLGQTFVRSMNTSLTVLITLAILFVFGPDATKDFALTLLVGIIAGTYSSVFLATPLLVTVAQFQANKASKK